jgi:hypothetical protein
MKQRQSNAGSPDACGKKNQQPEQDPGQMDAAFVFFHGLFPPFRCEFPAESIYMRQTGFSSL